MFKPLLRRAKARALASERNEIRAIRELLDAANAKVVQLSAKVDELRAQLLANRSVGLVDRGAFKVFMFTDDLGYKLTDPASRLSVVSKETLSSPPVESRLLDAVYRWKGTSVMERVLCHYFTNGLELAYIDVGAQYGGGAIRVALFLESIGRQCEVHCFEPGIARSLLPFNLSANGMQDRIRFHPLAVTDSTRPVLIFGEIGRSANFRLVNRDLASEGTSYVIGGVSIDDFVAQEKISSHLVLKIDTQGGEPEVLAGMQQTMEERYVTFVAEFTPHAIKPRVDPAGWLAGFFEDFHLLEASGVHVGESQRPCRVIAREGCGDFAREVDARPEQNTDVLFIPRKLPNVEELLGLLTAQ